MSPALGGLPGCHPARPRPAGLKAASRECLYAETWTRSVEIVGWPARRVLTPGRPARRAGAPSAPSPLGRGRAPGTWRTVPKGMFETMNIL